MRQPKNGRESFLKSLFLLSFVTGLVDAASVLGMGKVFVANMTGNVVFMGFAAVGTPGFRFAPLLAALAGFAIGALCAGRVLSRRIAPPRRIDVLLTVEALLLFGGAVLSIGYDPASLEPTLRLYSIVIASAAALGFRTAIVRHLAVADVTTTVLTMTIAGLAADSSLAGGQSPNRKRRIASILAICAGAAAGAGLFLHASLAVLLTTGGAIVLAAAALARPSRRGAGTSPAPSP